MKRANLRTKRLLAAALALLLCVTLLPLSALAEDLTATTMRIEQISGTVKLRSKSGQIIDFGPADLPLSIHSGETIETGLASYAAVSLDGSKAFQVNASSKIKIISIKALGVEKLDVQLLYGKVFGDITEQLGEKQKLTVTTGNSICGVVGTVFSAESVSPLVTILRVYKGHMGFTVEDNLSSDSVTDSILTGQAALGLTKLNGADSAEGTEGTGSGGAGTGARSGMRASGRAAMGSGSLSIDVANHAVNAPGDGGMSGGADAEGNVPNGGGGMSGGGDAEGNIPNGGDNAQIIVVDMSSGNVLSNSGDPVDLEAVISSGGTETGAAAVKEAAAGGTGTGTGTGTGSDSPGTVTVGGDALKGTDGFDLVNLFGSSIGDTFQDDLGGGFRGSTLESAREQLSADELLAAAKSEEKSNWSDEILKSIYGDERFSEIVGSKGSEGAAADTSGDRAGTDTETTAGTASDSTGAKIPAWDYGKEDGSTTTGGSSGGGTSGGSSGGSEYYDPDPPQQYTVRFDPNGGTGSMSPLTVTATTRVPDCTFKRDGWRFTGWRDGNGHDWAVGSYLPAPGSATVSDMTLYAQWEQVGFTVTLPDAGDWTISLEKYNGESYESADADEKFAAGDKLRVHFFGGEADGVLYGAAGVGVTCGGEPVTLTENGTCRELTNPGCDGPSANLWFTMPAGDVTVTGEFAPVYAVVCAVEGSGELSASADGMPTEYAAEGETVTVTATPAEGCTLDDLRAETADGTAVAVSASNTFAMPAGKVTVTATFAADTPAEEGYTVSLPDAGDWTISLEKYDGDGYEAASADEKFAAGDKLRVHFFGGEADGVLYGAAGVGVTSGGKAVTPDSGGTCRELTNPGCDGPSANLWFTMPAGDVTVTGEFAPVYGILSATSGSGTGTVALTADGMPTEYAAEGETVTVTATPAEGCGLTNLSYSQDGQTGSTHITETDGVYSFQMPAADVTVKATFKSIVATPTFSVTAGSYDAPFELTVSTTTGDALLCYTTDGAVPATDSDLCPTAVKDVPAPATIPVNESMTVKVFAYRDGWISSEIAEASYTLPEQSPDQVQTPYFTAEDDVFTLGAMSYFNVFLGCGTEGAEIRYTTDGTTPTAGSALYDETAGFQITGTTTVKAIALKDGMTASAVATKTFTQAYFINKATIENGTVTVTDAEGETISYAVPDATVCLTLTPDEGCVAVDTIAAYQGENGLVKCDLTENDDGTQSFQMPAADVTVSATFAEPAEPIAVTTLYWSYSGGSIVVNSVLTDGTAQTVTTDDVAVSYNASSGACTITAADPIAKPLDFSGLTYGSSSATCISQDTLGGVSAFTPGEDALSFTFKPYLGIRFEVSGTSGKLSGASVTLTPPGTSGSATTNTTSASGVAVFTGAGYAAGTYSYSVSMSGYETATGTVELADSDKGQAKTVALTLSEATSTYSVTIAEHDSSVSVWFMDDSTMAETTLDELESGDTVVLFTLADSGLAKLSAGSASLVGPLTMPELEKLDITPSSTPPDGTRAYVLTMPAASVTISTTVLTETQALYGTYDAASGTLTVYASDDDGRVTLSYPVSDGSTAEPLLSPKLNASAESVTKVVFAETIAPASTRSWFDGFTNLQEIDGIANLDTVFTTDMQNMFHGCALLETLDVSGFDTRQVTDMRNMFSGCAALTALELSGFRTAQAENMASMFDGCVLLAALDLSSFETGSVSDMSSMFCECNALETLTFGSGFDTGSVQSMNSMFYNCAALQTLDVSGFDTGSVQRMVGMFEGCAALTALDLSGFNTENVTLMSSMFSGCTNLETIYATSQFYTAKVLDYDNDGDEGSDMFMECAKLVGGAGSKVNEDCMDANYAHIDGGEDDPGYFTAKPTSP